MRRILALSVLLLLCCHAYADPAPPTLLLTTPGEVMVTDVPLQALPPRRMTRAWYAVSLKDGALVLDRVVTTRKPDWTLTTRSTAIAGGPTEMAAPEVPPARHALDMPDAAVLGFRLSDTTDSEAAFKAGVYPSFLRLPVLVQDRWKASFSVDGADWTLLTQSSRRKDGALLAGSLALFADNGRRQLLLPPAHGMAFERQELLWVGRLRPDSELDLLVKRIWITGEVEYVLRVGHALGYALIDPDRPIQFFSSGVEESEATDVHVAHKRQLPQGKFGLAAFSVGEEAWNSALAEAERQGLPAFLFDRQLSLNDEKVRFTMEYLPRIVNSGSAPSSSMLMWEGPIIIKAHFRGKTQALLQTGAQDGGGLRLQLGLHDGEPAIQMSFSPHYNNGFEVWWVWDATQQRFVRLYKVHQQGC